MLKGSTQSSNSHLCFFYLIYLFTFNFLYESGSVGLFTKIRFGLDVARRYVIFFFFFPDSEAKLNHSPPFCVALISNLCRSDSQTSGFLAWAPGAFKQSQN